MNTEKRGIYRSENEDSFETDEDIIQRIPQSIEDSVKTLIGNDLHIPHQDKEAIKEFLNYIQKSKPDLIILDGDIIDCESISEFDKVPGKQMSFKEEITMVRSVLEQVRKCARNCKIIYIEGNHEMRYRKMLMKQVPELYDLDELSIENLLGLNNLGIEYIPVVESASHFTDNFIENQNFLVGHFNIARSESGATAKALVMKYGMSIVQAHTHRYGVFSKRTYNSQLVGVENFCLCNLDQPYIRFMNCQQGFGEIIDGTYIPHPIKG